MPTHIAIIMDGNGRWAARHNLPRSKGHQAGADSAKAVISTCIRLGIPYLSLYAFSKENWSRPKLEIKALFELLTSNIKLEYNNLIDNSIKLNVLGDLSGLPFTARSILRQACAETASGTAMTLNLALNYSGRDEILRACRAIAAKNPPIEMIDEEYFQGHLFTAGQPDPDFIIRTSGEMRLSNFLLYQAAYSEFYFTETAWPEFTEKEFEKALAIFQSRKRRFGGLEME